MMDTKKVEQAISISMYLEGFHAGTNPSGRNKRHRIDPDTHAWWKMGHAEGVKALEVARTEIKHFVSAADRIATLPPEKK